MGLQDTPKGERIHIAVFGKRNAGKSSLINSITGQDLSIVSDVLGTTTDPVYKAMELLPLGPVMMIDTPGLDDAGVLGSLRVKKAKKVWNQSDIVLIVLDGGAFLGPESLSIEKEIIQEMKEKKLPYLVVLNKAEICPDLQKTELWIKKELQCEQVIKVSAKTKEGIEKLKELLGKRIPQKEERPLVRDLIAPNDFVVLVVPIDKAAPKGRLILPQQQTIRDILEASAVSIVVKETELKETLEQLGRKPKLVITDSQAFGKVSKDVPEDIWLTSFSILFARYKGELAQLIEGVKAIETLEEGDKILISEGCTHHRQCEDIGTVKIPRWLKEYTGKQFLFETSSGGGFPDDLSSCKMLVHCGACMLNRREMQFRLKQAKDAGVPIVNYGILIAYIHGILKRSLEPFKGIRKLLEK